MVENPCESSSVKSSEPKCRGTRWMMATIAIFLIKYTIRYDVFSDAIVDTPLSTTRWIHLRFNSRVTAIAYWPAVWSESNLRGLHIYATVEGGNPWTAPFYHIIPLA